MSAQHALSGRQFFHGTTETLTEVLPASKHGGGTVWPQTDSGHAYATSDLRQAQHWAAGAAARRGGLSRVYKVEPMGHHEPDPSTSSPSGFRSKTGWRVTGRVEW